MDLNDFFVNVSRIATALETIARNGTPVDYSEVKQIVEARGPRIDTAGTEGRTQPKALMEAVKEAAPDLNPSQVAHVVGTMAAVEEDLKVNLAPLKNIGEVDPKVKRVLAAIGKIHSAGTSTANGIAKELERQGVPHPRGIKWNNLSAKPFMDGLGIKSPYQVRGGRKPQTQAAPKPEAAKEPAPEPEPALRKINRAFVEREFKRPRMPDAHMSMRSLLSPKTQAKLEAHEKAQAADRALIDQAIAAGRVTKLPACTDSDGQVHGEQGCTIRPNGTGAFLGSLGPSASGARTRRVGSGP